MAEATPNPPGGRERISPVGKRAIAGAIIGWVVDFYDIYLPAGALTPALAFFMPETVPPPIRATILGVIVVVTLLGRPIGAFIFGHFGDVMGRKRTALIAIAGFGSMTLLMACMPGYATWGIAAVVILVVMRLIGGIFMGGEYTAANPLALEYTPHRLRGIVGSAIQASYPMSAIVVFFITALTFNIAPLGGPNSAYVQWGWRIPFFIGAGLAGLFFVYYWKSVEESRLWVQASKEKAVKAPLKVLFSGNNLRVLAQLCVIGTGGWFMAQSTITNLVPLLVTVLKVPAAALDLTLLFANIALVLVTLTIGQLGQWFGRRPLLILSGLWTLTAGVVIYYLLVTNILAGGSLVLTLALAALAWVVILAPPAQITTYVNERFPTGIRASAYGIGYTLPVIIPGFTNFYLLGLSKFMPYPYTMLVIVFVAGVLFAIGAAIGPETRDVEFTSKALDVVERHETEPAAGRRPVVS
ncbi:MAG: MFS transporter [Candidatus Dormibacteraeota bacterium]|nr:MFS transporter [Candidatus Dormibacteraeota bacterium]